MRSGLTGTDGTSAMRPWCRSGAELVKTWSAAGLTEAPAEAHVLRVREEVDDLAPPHLLLQRCQNAGCEQVGVVARNASRTCGLPSRKVSNSSGKTSSGPTGYHGSPESSASGFGGGGMTRKMQSVRYSISS